LLVLLRFLTILGVLWVLKWLVSFFKNQPAKPASTDSPNPAATDTVKDPVCGMYMDPRLGIRVQHKEGVVYFCSEECRRQFFGGAN
jgi:YHS domain-containing protein